MSDQPAKSRATTPRRVVRLKPPDYQPTQEELEEPIQFPQGTTLDDLAQAVVTPVKVVYEDD